MSYADTSHGLTQSETLTSKTTFNLQLATISIDICKLASFKLKPNR